MTTYLRRFLSRVTGRSPKNRNKHLVYGLPAERVDDPAEVDAAASTRQETLGAIKDLRGRCNGTGTRYPNDGDGRGCGGCREGENDVTLLCMHVARLITLVVAWQRHKTNVG